MQIMLWMPAEPRHRRHTRYDLDRLLASDDGLREVEDEIRATLERGEVYRGGGGAAPVFILMTVERAEKLEAVWGRVHRDYRGEMDGERTLLVYRNGTTLVRLADLTDAEIANRLPKVA